MGSADRCGAVVHRLGPDQVPHANQPQEP